MSRAQIIDYIINLANAFYRSILKLSINAHQLIAYWRVRINNNKNNFNRRVVVPDQTSNLGKLGSTSDIKTLGTELSSPQEFEYYQISSVKTTAAEAEVVKTSQQTGLTIKTPDSKRFKLYSILRRLSIRNFMEYCVIALNEASSSSCSNKFDLNSCETPVWLLGKQYKLPEYIDDLVGDIKSRLWITYRRNFPPIDENARYTTDRGFGCMIRCGQMVLANALIYKNLGRDWRWSSNGIESNPDVYRKILKLFQDKEDCPYSIHNIVRSGQQEGIVIGEWFGPNTIAQALKRMAMTYQKTNNLNNNEVLISIDAALDNVVVIDEIKSKFKQPQQTNATNSNNDETNNSSTVQNNDDGDGDHISTQWIPGILFIQLRLGLSKINPLYFAALRKTFQFKNSLGIIGGRPNHALYLIGHTENDIIYLDPHSTQQYIDFDTFEETGLETTYEQLSDNDQQQQQQPLPVDSSYHCACPERMPIDRLDPSLALCFYFHTEQEFDDWCSLSNDLLIKIEQAPMFEIIKSRSYESCSTTITTATAILDLSGSKKSDEEFEMLG